MNKPTEFCATCPIAPADVQSLAADAAECNGPIVAIDAVTVTGLRGKELRSQSDDERRLCGREWTEPTEDGACTIYSNKQADGDTVAITTYGDSARRIRNLPPVRQERLVQQYLAHAEQSGATSRPQVKLVQSTMGLHLAQTDAERARNVGGFEADQQVVGALTVSEQVTTEVHDLLYETLGRTKVQESVRALAMINTVARLMPELYEADAAARSRLHRFLGEMGVNGATSAQYEQFARSVERYKAPFEPFDVSNEPTVLVLKQRLYAAAHMLAGGQFESAHTIALKRADFVSQSLAEVQHEDGLAATELMRGVSDRILECKEKVNDLVMHLSLVRAQY